MDGTTLLRSYRDDIAEPGAEELAALRAHVLTGIAERTPRSRSRRRWLLAGSAAAVAGGVVIAGVAGAGPMPRSSAHAAELLARAAGATAAPSAAWTRVVTHEAALAYQQQGDRIASGYLDVSVRTVYVPADPRRKWISTSYHLPPTRFWGSGARAGAARDAAFDATPAHPAIERARGGRFGSGELGGGSFFGDDPAEIAALPTDPQQLLEVLRGADTGVDDDATRAEHVLDAAALVLRRADAGQPLQAAVFRALRLQLGITVTGDAAVLGGRRGTAVGVAADQRTGHERHELVIDPADGAYLGDRTIDSTAAGAVPAGTVIDSTAVTRSGVAAPPAALLR